MKSLLSFLNESLINENKGLAFEVNYINDFETKYREGLEQALNLPDGSLKGSTLEQLGGQNNKRPLIKRGDYIFLGSKKGATVPGDDIVDVELISPKGDIFNLSLKSGETVTFCNVGIALMFPKTAFKDYEETGTFNPGTVGQCNGADLLDMFGIDPERFANVFVKYKKKHSKRRAEKTVIDITDYLQKSKTFMKFIESVVGYGYILVHEKRNSIHYYDLRTLSDMKNFIGDIKNAKIMYPIKGQAKRIDILIEFDNLKIKFNIRDKAGGVYPTGLMADYNVIN